MSDEKRPWLRLSENLAGVNFLHPAFEDMATLSGIIQLWAAADDREEGDTFDVSVVFLTDAEAAALPET